MTTDTPLPDALYHYTTIGGLYGILSRQEFWLTNFESLNDSSEILHGLSRIQERVTRIVRAETHEPTREMLEFVASQLGNPMATFDRDPQLLEPSSVAVCAFSEAEDDLAQWRAYGTTGEGFALRVRPEVLRDLAQSQGIRLAKCVYSDEEIAQVVDDMISPFVDELHRNVATSVYQNFWTASVATAALIKHPAFAAEREWRLVRSNLPLYGMESALVNGRLRAVVKLKWESQRDLVQRVVIGPHDNAALTARALGPLLATSIGSPSMFDVSRIPFRAR